MDDGYACIRQAGIPYPPECEHPPKLSRYPTPPYPVKLLFMGWNPPKPFGGFWSLEDDDAVRSHIHRILRDLGDFDAAQPDGTFLQEFLERGYYFLHAVKCWSQAKFPGFGRDRRNAKQRRPRRELGLSLLDACVRTHLAAELRMLSPQGLCVLGELPFRGLCTLYPAFNKSRPTPTQGRMFPKGSCGQPFDLLYSCFPSDQRVQVRGKGDRHIAWKLLADHLSKFLPSLT